MAVVIDYQQRYYRDIFEVSFSVSSILLCRSIAISIFDTSSAVSLSVNGNSLDSMVDSTVFRSIKLSVHI